MLFCYKDIETHRSNNLDLNSSFDGLTLLLGASNSLRAHDTTTPVASGVLILVGVALLDSGKELSELGLILLANLSDGKNRRGLEKFQLATSPKNFFFFFRYS